MSKRRPYIRSNAGWWKKNPYFVEYVIHEGTALFVLAYAIILLVGLVRLGQGEAAWNGWLEALQSPASVLLHVVLLAAVAYHAYTWFKIMPITLPPVMIGGKRLSAAAIFGGGLAAAAASAVVLFALVWRISA